MKHEGALAPDILIVDDDDGHAILTRENLEAAALGNPIRHFRDGQAVLDFLFEPGSHPPASKAGAYLLLLDIRMPKVDGVEVLRRLRADPKQRNLAIIVLTSADDAREVERCHALGCDVYLKKPVDFGKFADAVRRLGLSLTLLIKSPSGAD